MVLVGHVVLKMPEVKFGPSNGVGHGLDPSGHIKEFESYLLSSISNDVASITKCLERLEKFAGTAVESS